MVKYTVASTIPYLLSKRECVIIIVRPFNLYTDKITFLIILEPTYKDNF